MLVTTCCKIIPELGLHTITYNTYYTHSTNTQLISLQETKTN